MGLSELVSRATSTLASTKNEEDELVAVNDALASDMDCAAAKVAEGLHEIHTEQVDETADFYLEVMRKAASLNAVKVDREKFLRAELGKLRSNNDLDKAVAETPIAAGFSPHQIDKLAVDSIEFETKKCVAISTLAGIPGGLAIAATIPGDVAQYFMHVMRVEQKLAYLYGWESFITDGADEIDDETLAKLITLMGVMMGVGSATNSISKFAATAAKQGVSKQIEKQALTKTSWYVPMKQVLRFFGVNVTKKTFANTAAKAVPVVGGLVSGGITYYSFKPSAEKLRRYLRTLPLSGIDPDVPDFEAIDRAENIREGMVSAVQSVGSSITDAGGKAGEFISENAPKAIDTAGKAIDTVGTKLGEAGESAGAFITQIAPVANDVAKQAGTAVAEQASVFLGTALGGLKTVGGKLRKKEQNDGK